MNCRKCSSDIIGVVNFCSECGSRVSGDTFSEIKPRGGYWLRRQYSRVAFVFLTTFLTYLCSLIFSERLIGSIAISGFIAENFAYTAVGFFLAKLILKNSKKTWVELILFQIVNISGSFILFLPTGGHGGFFSLIFALIFSLEIFWVQSKLSNRSKPGSECASPRK